MRSLKSYLFKQRLYILHAFMLGTVLLLSSACVPILEVNDEFEYNPSKKRELNELKRSYALLSRMEEIDVALHLSKRDFLSLVNHSFQKFSEHFTSLGAGEFSNVRFGSMKFHLSNQQIVSKIEFSLHVDGLEREIYGHVMAKHKLEAASNMFILKTGFDEIIVQRIDGTKVMDKNSENIKLIEKAAKNFMQALNVEISNTPLSIPVDLNILSRINGKDIFFASDYQLHSAKSINMLTKMRMYLPYIDKNGVVFLGSGKTKYTSEPPKEGVDIREMSHKLRSKIDAGLQKSMGVSLAFVQEESSYYVSKDYLSEQMNFSLMRMDLRMINKFFLKMQGNEQNISQKIYFSGKDRLPSCDGVAKDCAKIQQQCHQNCSRTYGTDKCSQCDRINNPFEKVRCMSDFEACKSKEELHLYECLKEQDRCTRANTESDKQCRTENLNLIAQCEKKKERLPFMKDKMVLAKLHLKFSISNSYAIQRIHKIVFDGKLNNLQVDRNLHVSVDSRVDFDIEKTDNKDINCTLEGANPLFVYSSADHMDLHKDLPVLTEVLADGALMIKAESKENLMRITLENSPYSMLLEPDNFAINCNYQNMPLGIFTAEQIVNKENIPHALAAMLGEITLKFEAEELSFRVPPVKIGKGLFLYPRMQERAIGFTRQAHFY